MFSPGRHWSFMLCSHQICIGHSCHVLTRYWSFMLCSHQVCIGHSCYVLTRHALVIHVMFSPGMHWSFTLCSHQMCIGHSCYVLTSCRYAQNFKASSALESFPLSQTPIPIHLS